MDIKEQVEDVLVRQGAGHRRAVTEPIGVLDGYVIEHPGGRAAIVRRGPTAVADFPAPVGRRRVVIIDTLAMCADVLHEAGFCVQQARDERGPYISVATP